MTVAPIAHRAGVPNTRETMTAPLFLLCPEAVFAWGSGYGMLDAMREGIQTEVVALVVAASQFAVVRSSSGPAGKGALRVLLALALASGLLAATLVHPDPTGSAVLRALAGLVLAAPATGAFERLKAWPMLAANLVLSTAALAYAPAILAWFGW